MTPEEHIQKIKEQSRIRSEKYYNNNRAKISKRRTMKRKGETPPPTPQPPKTHPPTKQPPTPPTPAPPQPPTKQPQKTNNKILNFEAVKTIIKR
jgi:hypothetical protein